MKLFDIRMEKTLKSFEESAYMQAMSSLGNSHALFSSGGQLVVLMTPTGQIIAFDVNSEKFVGCLGQSEYMTVTDSSFSQYNGPTIIKDFSWQP